MSGLWVQRPKTTIKIESRALLLWDPAPACRPLLDGDADAAAGMTLLVSFIEAIVEACYEYGLSCLGCERVYR